MRVLAALVSSLYLPVGTNWFAVQPAGPTIRVVGFTQAGDGCVRLDVSPSTLSARGPKARCPGPQTTYDPRSFRATLSYAGRVLFRFDSYSDTKAEWTFAGRVLWAYDVATTRGPMLVRVAGSRMQTIAMPKMYRLLLAADDDGLWLTPSTNGGMAGPGPSPVLHVTPNGRVSIVHEGGRAALWIAAHAHTVWMEQISGASDVSIWRFDGPNAKPRLLARPRGFFPDAAAYGDGSLWAVTGSRPCRDDRVFRIDPSTGARTRVASVPALDSCFGPEAQGIAFANGSVYFLDVPRLYRIEP